MTAGRISLAGALAWIGFVAAILWRSDDSAWVQALLLFAVLVLVPLSLELLVERNEALVVVRWFAWVRLGQLPAALLLATACWMKPGLVAAALTVPWLALTALLAACGILRAWRHGWARPLGRLCGDVALAFLGIGGMWALADRAGLRPLNFGPGVIALIALHFHYAGFLLPIFVGLVQRRMPESRFVARVTVGVVLGVPALAAGVTATQFGLGSTLEAAAGAGLALAGMMVGVLHVRRALEADEAPLARLFLGAAGVSLFFVVILSGAYAVREFAVPMPWLARPQMLALHGAVNAFGFGLCGVLGWRAAQPI